MRYTFHAYSGTGEGTHVDRPEVTEADYEDRGAAKGFAGRLAKRIDGPVDLAKTGDDPWEDRYLTTARPSEFHSTGYAFERLD